MGPEGCRCVLDIVDGSVDWAEVLVLYVHDFAAAENTRERLFGFLFSAAHDIRPLFCFSTY